MLRSNIEQVVRKSIANFVDKELIPNAQKIDEKGDFPSEVFMEMGKMRVFGTRYPKNKGGSGGNSTLFCIIMEELARGLMSVAAITGMQGLMGTHFLFRFGTQEMHEKFFLPAMKGEKIACFCMTEPEAGSDLGNVRTIATKTNDGFVINGMKTWVTNGPVADFYTVLCQTDPGKKFKGLNFFFVPRETVGLSVSKPFECLGTRTTKISEVYFSDCQIPVEYRLGAETDGMDNLLKLLAEIRAHVACQAIGLQRAALADSIRYARERVVFGRTINNYQLISAKISNMAVDLEASKLLAYNAARMIDNGIDCMKEATMAKYFATEAACRAADEGTRILGGYAYSMEYTVQRYFRDHRFLLYGGGTHEVLQTNLARWVGL